MHDVVHHERSALEGGLVVLSLKQHQRRQQDETLTQKESQYHEKLDDMQLLCVFCLVVIIFRRGGHTQQNRGGTCLEHVKRSVEDETEEDELDVYVDESGVSVR